MSHGQIHVQIIHLFVSWLLQVLHIRTIHPHLLSFSHLRGDTCLHQMHVMSKANSTHYKKTGIKIQIGNTYSESNLKSDLKRANVKPGSQSCVVC